MKSAAHVINHNASMYPERVALIYKGHWMEKDKEFRHDFKRKVIDSKYY
jgi:hypothetical protein